MIALQKSNLILSWGGGGSLSTDFFNIAFNLKNNSHRRASVIPWTCPMKDIVATNFQSVQMLAEANYFRKPYHSVLLYSVP